MAKVSLDDRVCAVNPSVCIPYAWGRYSCSQASKCLNIQQYDVQLTEVLRPVVGFVASINKPQTDELIAQMCFKCTYVSF